MIVFSGKTEIEAFIQKTNIKKDWRKIKTKVMNDKRLFALKIKKILENMSV